MADTPQQPDQVLSSPLDQGPATTAPDTQPWPANLERESPLPIVDGSLDELFTDPGISPRDRRLGMMALGQHTDSWY